MDTSEEFLSLGMSTTKPPSSAHSIQEELSDRPVSVCSDTCEDTQCHTNTQMCKYVREKKFHLLNAHLENTFQAAVCAVVMLKITVHEDS